MKGFKMLPFIAGIAAGCLAVYAYNNKGKIKDVAKDGIQKSKEAFDGAKDFAIKNIEKITDTKENSKTKKTATKKASSKKTTTKKSTVKKEEATKPKTTRKRKVTPKEPVEKEEKVEDNNE